MAPVKTSKIEGVTLRDVLMRIDERGHLGELYSTNFGDENLCHVYRCMVRPGIAKAMHCHVLQTDRFTPIAGVVKVGLVDMRRPDSLESVTSSAYLGGQLEEGKPFHESWRELWADAPPDRRLQQDVVILDASRPQVLTIPAGVAHGIYSLNGQCGEILNAPTRPFDHEKNDELRLPADLLGFQWEPESK